MYGQYSRAGYDGTRRVVKFSFKCLAEFLCGDDHDCNGKGVCVDSKCDCVPGWDSSFDCHGEYLVHFEKYMVNLKENK